MELRVFSRDGSLLELCREVAAEFHSVSWSITPDSTSSGHATADLCFWDYQPGMAFPRDLRWGTKHFALVEPSYLPAFRSSQPSAEAGIALKPVTYAVLRAIMAQAGWTAAAGAECEVHSARSERDELLQWLMHSNLRLQQYDADRTNFLGRALHDFHAPLTVLSGYCGLLLDDHGGPLNAHQRAVIQKMHHSVRRLSRMSQAMFQLSAGRHISHKPAVRSTDIRDCIEQAVCEVQPFAEEKEIQIEAELEAPATPLLSNPEQIEQVAIHLLENGCKFAPRGSAISVRGYIDADSRRLLSQTYAPESEHRSRDESREMYRVDIGDSGPKIADERLESVFEEHAPYSGGHDRSRGGLGLAICRMILTQHGGCIWAENCNSGPVFSFMLPLHPGAQLPRDHAPTREPDSLSGRV